MLKDKYIKIKAGEDTLEVNEHHLSILSIEAIKENLELAEQAKDYQKCALLRDEINKREKV